MDRLNSAIHRLKLAAEDLRDLAEPMPTIDHGSAAFVVAEAAKELVQLYDDLNTWDIEHDYTARDMQHLNERLRQLSEETTESISQDQP